VSKALRRISQYARGQRTAVGGQRKFRRGQMFGYKIVTDEEYWLIKTWGDRLKKKEVVTVQYHIQQCNIFKAEMEEVKKSRARWRQKAHQYRRERRGAMEPLCKLLVEKLVESTSKKAEE
jgi:hypothetical protein